LNPLGVFKGNDIQNQVNNNSNACNIKTGGSIGKNELVQKTCRNNKITKHNDLLTTGLDEFYNATNKKPKKW
jgi:hypothetical protein